MTDRPSLRLDTLRRRLLIAGAASPFALSAQPASQNTGAPQDWLDLIKQQHQQIKRALDTLVAPDNQPWDQRRLQFRTVRQLLDAHQLAEEDVVYPALVRAGFASQADHLYAEESHVKVLMARLVLLAHEQGSGKEWTSTARELRDAVLEHALKDEEQDTLPQLHGKLQAPENQMLSQLFPVAFATVVPARRA